MPPAGKPVRTAVVLVAVIFGVEMVIMSVYSLAGASAWMPEWLHDSSDALILSVVASLSLYWLVVIPQRRAMEHTNRLNWLLQFLSHVNRVVQRQTDEHKAFQETCAAAVERGGFRFAWIGLRDGGAAGGLRLMAEAACSEAVLNDVRQADGDHIPCALATEAAFHGRTAHCNLMAEIQCAAAWRGPLLGHGCRSAAAFPILREHECIGAFCVYASDGGFFEDNEISILEEVADDVSHTLNHFAAEARRAQAEETMRQRLDELERFQKTTVQREFRIKALRDEIEALKKATPKGEV